MPPVWVWVAGGLLAFGLYSVYGAIVELLGVAKDIHSQLEELNIGVREPREQPEEDDGP